MTQLVPDDFPRDVTCSSEMGIPGQTEPRDLVLDFYDGEYTGDLAALTYICEIEGSVVPHGLPAFSLLEETLRVLETCVDKYSTPRPAADCFTVFIGRKAGGTETVPRARLDVYARDGYASAGVVGFGPRWDSEPVMYSPDDDAVAIVRKILEGSLHRGS